MPAGLGAASVFAPGYAPGEIEVEQEDITVRLLLARSLRGRIRDAVSGEPVAMELELVHDLSRASIRTFESNADGSFAVPDLAADGYVLLGECEGYIPLVAKTSGGSPGVEINLRPDDLEVDLKAFPVYGAAVIFENRTNLSDVVLGSMMNWSSTRPDSLELLPSVSYGLRVATRRRYLEDHPCAVLEILAATAPDAAEVTLHVGLAGEALPEKTIVLTRLTNGLTIYRDALTRTWEVAELTIRTSMPMRLERKGTFGGIPVAIGETRLQVPHGTYTLQPPYGLLSSAEEFHQVIEVPGRSEVQLETAGRVARLVLRRSPDWIRNVCLISCKAPRASCGYRLDAEFPATQWVRPGRYRLYLERGSLRESADHWLREVEVAADQTVEIEIGG